MDKGLYMEPERIIDAISFLSANGMNKTFLAKKLGICRETLYKWLMGVSMPRGKEKQSAEKYLLSYFRLLDKIYTKIEYKLRTNRDA